MKSMKRATGIFAISATLAVLAAIAGALLWTGGGAQAEPPEGFRYADITKSATLLMVEGQDIVALQRSGWSDPGRVPLHGKIEFYIVGKSTGTECGNNPNYADPDASSDCPLSTTPV